MPPIALILWIIPQILGPDLHLDHRSRSNRDFGQTLVNLRYLLSYAVVNVLPLIVSDESVVQAARPFQ